MPAAARSNTEVYTWDCFKYKNLTYPPAIRGCGLIMAAMTKQPRTTNLLSRFVHEPFLFSGYFKSQRLFANDELAKECSALIERSSR